MNIKLTKEPAIFSITTEDGKKLPGLYKIESEWYGFAYAVSTSNKEHRLIYETESAPFFLAAFALNQQVKAGQIYKISEPLKRELEQAKASTPAPEPANGSL